MIVKNTIDLKCDNGTKVLKFRKIFKRIIEIYIVTELNKILLSLKLIRLTPENNKSPQQVPDV
jgi:hypothetical protein